MTEPFSCFLCGSEKLANGDCASVNCSSNKNKFYIGVKSTGGKDIFSPPLEHNPYINILGPYKTKEKAKKMLDKL